MDTLVCPGCAGAQERERYDDDLGTVTETCSTCRGAGQVAAIPVKGMGQRRDYKSEKARALQLAEHAIAQHLGKELYWTPTVESKKPKRFHVVKVVRLRDHPTLDAEVELETPNGKILKWVSSHRLKETV